MLLVSMELNRGKTELICADHTSRGIVLSALPGLRIINPECANLLGSPLGNADCVNACVSEKIELLRLMGDRLCYLHSHDAITLLRYSFAIPKLLHSLRTAPCFSSPLLPDYDLLLQPLLSKIVNIHFQVDDPAWLQATLPVSAGGLGIRSAVHLAPSAFLASADGSTDLVHHLLPSRLSTTLYPGREDALASWRDGLDQSQSPPVPPTSYRQKMWDLPRIQARADALVSDASDPVTRARLLAVSAKESGAWLNSLPISSLGLRMDNDTIRIAIGLRLGSPLCQPHKCVHCGSDVNKFGTHGLSCRWSQGRHSRHSEINSIIHRSLVSARVPSRLEPTGLSRSDGKRPDGMTIVPWYSGKLLVWDATCSDTFAPSNLSKAVSRSGAVADHAETLKSAKYSHLDSAYMFVPVAVETSGAFGSKAHSFIRELGRRLKSATEELKSYQYLTQRLSVAVQRGNAAAVLGTMGNQSGGLDLFL